MESQATPESEADLVSAGPENAPTTIQKTEPESDITEPVEESTPQVTLLAEVCGETVVRTLSHANWLVTQEPTTVEQEDAPEDISKVSSWTPSYSTIVQGSGPHFDSETVLQDDSEAISSELPVSNDVSATSQDAEPAPAPAEPVATEEVPSAYVPSERPSDVFDTSSDETPAAEEVEAAVTPKIVTPADEEPVGPAATTEINWTQSYSTTLQPGSPRVSPKAEMEELEPESHSAEPIQETPVAPPVFELADVPKTVVTRAVEDEDERVAEQTPEEASKPAWTQSYSVISQPGSPRLSPKQVPEEIPEAEEVKPSWTRSYSVTSQPGSPRILPKEDLPEPTLELVAVADEPIAAVTPPIEVAPAPAEASALERPKSPWTSSYSVTTLEGQAEQVPPEDAAPEPEVVPVPKTLDGEAPDPQPEVDAPATDTLTPEPLAVKDEEPKRPRSPWTPSYSVTTIPGSASVEEPEPHPVTNEPPVDVGAVKDEHLKENGTTSDVFEVHEAVTQLTVHGEPQVDVKTLEPALPQLDLVSFTCGC